MRAGKRVGQGANSAYENLLGRSLRHLIDTVADLQEQRIGFKSLTESIDPTTSSGKLVFHIFDALAESQAADPQKVDPLVPKFLLMSC